MTILTKGYLITSCLKCCLAYKDSASVMGYFSSKRWGNNKKSSDTQTCDEISINPDYVGRSALIELFQTLVHEMTHQWQYHHGQPSKRSYHNKEWAHKMEKIGLMPSSTGRVGGKKTGEKMNDYPISGGLFINECMALIKKDFSLPWIDRQARAVHTDSELMNAYGEVLTDISDNELEVLIAPVSSIFDDVSDGIEALEETETKAYKKRYHCPDCLANVWG